MDFWTPSRFLICCHSKILDGQDRHSPIASDFGSQTQIAALFAILTYRTVELIRIAKRAFRIAIQIAGYFRPRIARF